MRCIIIAKNYINYKIYKKFNKTNYLLIIFSCFIKFKIVNCKKI